MQCKAVEMMRKIRDQISRETRDMSPAEEIAYYRAASRRFEAKMAAAREKNARQGRGQGEGKTAVSRQGRPAALAPPLEA